MLVRVHTAIDQLSEIRPAWEALLAETPYANFYQSLDWLETYWQHFGSDQRLRVLEVSEAGETVGIVPLVIRRETTRLGPIRFLTYPLDYWGSFYGPIARDPSSALAAAVSSLDHACRDWDVVELRGVGVTDNECRKAQSVLTECGFDPVVGMLNSSAIIDLSTTWESYLSKRGSKWRNNLKRWQRRLCEMGELRYERYRPGGKGDDPRWDLFDDCLEIARKSWQGSSKSGTTISHQEISEFIRDAHQTAAACGCADVNLLYVEDRPVAFAYNYQYQGYVFGLRVGYDPELKSRGVGNVLYAHAIEDSITRGDWRYDMGPGSLEAKKRLQTHVLGIYRLSCFCNNSLRLRAIRWKREREAQQLPTLNLSDLSASTAGMSGLEA